ncbi:glucosidase II beta subunit, putative [Entamoeba dispar SAW760]|uniref:Glucosidase 2 subunit beta n=1 Tax=Entamoeba dispar (strain ATCC PRA-260 / SAW760) TaxID=370354 RepID=B0EFM4_ENTDS|nr:glucosidase II beta subunit, putative [Entamoeba dispar SAW760]EDR26655.1 glucosidase II beta subunit, putative [Entamoeba dispar SAW760]|eukprot:EDR26655.1 glucosidase II beta subunit, putative [Entamoeba dispar SAW760]
MKLFAIIFFIAFSSSFKCETIDITIPDSFIDDRYCDCPDGSDEKNTGVCEGSMFICQNKGADAVEIESRFVGDSICDCCDGSDEREGLCPNVCKQQTQKKIDEVDNEIKRMEELIQLKEKFSIEGKKLRKELSKEIKKNEAELKEVKEELKIGDFDNIIKEQKRKRNDFNADYQERYNSLKSKIIEEVSGETSEEVLEEKIKEYGFVSPNEEEVNVTSVEVKKEENEKSKEEIKEEQRKLKLLIKEEETKFKKEDKKLEKEIKELEEKQKELENKKEVIERKVWEFNEKSKVNIKQNNYCNDYFFLNEYSKDNFKLYYGFNITQNNNINVGSFAGWNTSDIQFYSNGTTCEINEQTIPRKAEVHFVCGETPSIISTDEPSTCEYVLVLQTPCACSKKLLKSLHEKRKQLEEKLH